MQKCTTLPAENQTALPALEIGRIRTPAEKLAEALAESRADHEADDSAQLAAVDEQVEARGVKIDGLKRRLVHDILAIGDELVAVRELLSVPGRGGKFTAWIQSRCKFSRRSAYSYIEAAQLFGSENRAKIAQFFGLSAIYLIAAKDYPPEAVEAAFRRASEGEHIDRKLALDLKRQFGPGTERPTRRRDSISPGGFPPDSTEKSKATRENVQTENPEWLAPPEHIELCRTVMGGIDLNPANTDDGLSHPWLGRVFLNPPPATAVISQFTAKLCAEYHAGNVEQAIFLSDSMTGATWWQVAAEAATAICFVAADSPTRGQTFLYFGQNSQDFVSVFSALGFTLPTTPNTTLDSQ